MLFVEWLQAERLEPCVVFEWDDYLVEWKRASGVSIHKISNAIAALELFVRRNALGSDDTEHPRPARRVRFAEDDAGVSASTTPTSSSR